MIGHASCDERGKYAGGQAGDQSKKEVCVRTWYDRPWNVLMWSPDPDVREKMAVAMEQACANDNIGYDQGTVGNSNDRYSLYNLLLKNGFDIKAVNTPCETDCSNLVACCACCSGVDISPYIYTGNERSAFKKAGFIVKVRGTDDEKYFTSDDYAYRGSVWLYEGHHTAINLTAGRKTTVQDGWVKAGNDWYYYRNGAPLQREWLAYKNHWYRLGTDGRMLKGWHQIYDNNHVLKTFYFDETDENEGALWHETVARDGALEVWTLP